MFFLLPATQFASGGMLTNSLDPVEWPYNLADPSEAKKFLLHPPLFQLVLSSLAPSATPQGIFLAISFINILVIFFTTLLFYKIVSRKEELNWWHVGVIVMALLALVASLLEIGRPETLSRLWVVLGALVPFYVSKKYDWIFYGILLGFLFATHLAAGAVSFIVLGLFFGITLSFKKIVLKSSAILCIAFFTVLGVIAIGPFGIRETIEGSFMYATIIADSTLQEAANSFTLSNLLNNYVFSQVAPFYGLVILLFVISGAFFFWKYRNRITTPIVATISAIAIFYIIGKIIYTIGHVYYITLFTPIIFSIFIYLFLETKWFSRVTVLMVFAFVATGFARVALLFPFFIKQEPSLSEARVRIMEIIRPYKDTDVKFGIGAGFGGGVWYFFDDYKNLYSYSSSKKPKEKTAFIFSQQRYSGLLKPPEIAWCRLIVDEFSREIPKMFGVKLGNTMPGYGYAVYNCLENNG